MASPYATGTPAGGGGKGGSAYASGTPAGSGGRGGSAYAGGTPAGARSVKSGGGHGVLGGLGRAAHWTADKAGLAAHDVLAIPGGIEQMAVTGGKELAQTVRHPIVHGAQAEALRQEWTNVARGHVLRPAPADSPDAAAMALVQGQIRNAAASVLHPLRDPFQTVLTVAPILAGVGRVGEAAGLVPKGPRLIGTGETRVALHPSANPAVRAVQAGYDVALQRALEQNPEGRLGAHAARRIGGSIAETTRFQQRMRDAVANDLEASGRRLGSKTLAQAALRLTSENSTAEEAAAFHRAQAGKGVAPKANLKLAALYDRLAAKGMLTRDEQGNVAVDAAKHPELAAVDAKLAAGQTRVDQILRDYGMMSEEGLAARRDLPGQIRRTGAPSPAPTWRTTPSGVPKLAGFEPAVEPTRPMYGVEGRGYVPYKVSEPKAPRTSVAASTGPVVGEARPPVGAKAFTGAGLEKGLVPDATTALVARHMRKVFRFVSTDQFRRSALQTGSDVRRSSRDVLVRVPEEKAAQIPLEVERALGRKQVNLDELHGHQLALSAYLDRLIPGRTENFASDKAAPIGVPAPAGYRWVDRGVLGDNATFRPRPGGKIARAADTVNSAVTAATVYFKVGHVGTRVLTNAATTIIQGSAKPVELGRSFRLWRQLGSRDRLRALAAAGQHGFAAMPAEVGAGRVSRAVGAAARGGAQFWARHADAPFRFASIAYEARRAGFDTPARFRLLLDKLEDPSGLSPVERAGVEAVAKEANRAGIAYDRLNPLERNYISRAVWFLPWIKGSTVFAGRTFEEHPYKSAVLGAAGAQGRQAQQAQLGTLPSYEQGLFRLAGGERPLVADWSTFSPFSTPADVTQAVARPAGLAGFLNPVYSAGAHLIAGQGQYGQPTTSPVTSALAELGAPTPEAQILTAYLRRHQDQSQRMFRTTPESALSRALAGPGLPRRVNLAAAHKAAARERSGR